MNVFLILILILIPLRWWTPLGVSNIAVWRVGPDQPDEHRDDLDEHLFSLHGDGVIDQGFCDKRLETAIATCGKHNRSFFQFLHQSITAKLTNQPASSLRSV